MIFSITLGKEFGYFDQGYARTDNDEEIPLKAWYRTATYGRDSILIDTVDHFGEGRFPVRWFVMDGAIEFYGMDKDAPELYLTNESGIDIRVDRYGVLRDGEGMRVVL